MQSHNAEFPQRSQSSQSLGGRGYVRAMFSAHTEVRPPCLLALSLGEYIVLRVDTSLSASMSMANPFLGPQKMNGEKTIAILILYYIMVVHAFPAMQ